MAEETLNVSAENPEENPQEAPTETRVHPREIMGDALPRPATQTQTAQKQAVNKPQVSKAQKQPTGPVIPALVEKPVDERAMLFQILAGASSAHTQNMLTAHRRRSGVSKSHDTTARMKKVARDALSTN